MIDQALVEVNHYVHRCLQSEDELVTQMNQHALQQQGKQLRPRLVLLTAKAIRGTIYSKTYRGAALVGLMHHASLLHDDVIDQALYRRNVSTINAVWGNKMAILLGDYVLSSALGLATENQDYDYVATLSSTARLMSEGEILQLKQAKEGALSEAVYLQIIQKKTASLLAASCAIGALSVAADHGQVNALYEVGIQWGMAFQLSDDLLDYGVVPHTGKSPLMDLNSSIFTLPLIYALKKAPKKEGDDIKSFIKSSAETPFDVAFVQEILTFVYHWGGIDHTVKRVLAYQEEAIRLLRKHVQASDAREALVDLIHTSMPLKGL
eukprot:gene728-901_t